MDGDLAITYQTADGAIGTLRFAAAEVAAGEGAATEAAPAPAAIIEATFVCPDGTTLDTTFDNTADTVTVALPDGTVTLPRAVSGSGARYSDGTTTFWNNGDEALVEVNGEIVYDKCVAQ
jgi:membrane-bound inhibitor of C-type lysozyme